MKKLVLSIAIALFASISIKAQTDITSSVTLQSWSQPLTVINDDAMPWSCTNGTDIWTPKLSQGQSTTLTLQANPTKKSTLDVNVMTNSGAYVTDHDKLHVEVYVDDVLKRTINTMVLALAQPDYFFDLEAGEHTIKIKVTSDRTTAATDQCRVIVRGLMDTEHTVVAEVTEPGSLGQEILYDESVNVLADVRSLKVSGTLNAADWTTIRNMGTTLWKIDLTGVTNTEIPAAQFQRNGTTWQYLHEVKLPSALTAINDNAFANSYITAIDLPATTDKIGHSAFNNSCLDAVTLPASYCIKGYNSEVGRTYDNVFTNCRALQSLTVSNDNILYLGKNYLDGCVSLRGFTMPTSVTKVYSYGCRDTWHNDFGTLSNITHMDYEAFSRSGVTHLNLQQLEGLNPYYEHAYHFGGSQELTTVTIGEKFFRFNSYYTNEFADCPKLKTVKLYSSTVCAYNRWFTANNLADMTLQVPNYLVNNYKVDANWMRFGTIEGFSTEDTELFHINQSLTLGARQRMEGSPSLDISNNLVFKIAGETAQTFNNVKMRSDQHNKQYTQIISTCPNVSVASATLSAFTRGGRWYAMCLPFDIKVADIAPATGSYAVRYYDGAERATNGIISGNKSWKDYAAEDVISAGTGFIFNTSAETWSIIPSNGNGDKLFGTAAHTTSLQAYPSETPANQGWNLIGNPYQCYYDVKAIGFNAPITTYSHDYYGNITYTAYSLTDDDYILRPNEAFFVQAPDGVSDITFGLSGKQTVSTVVTQAKPMRRVQGTSERNIVDLTVSNGEGSDRTRVVMNEDAKMDYELTCDASKMLGTGLQVYTLGDNELMYAINERPMADGLVYLGLIIPTDGTYTFSLTRNTAKSVRLTDLETGADVDLTAGNYTFNAGEGTVTNRFMLKIQSTTTAIHTLPSTETVKTVVYDITGRRVANNLKGLKPGVYIVNGRKVYIK